MMIAPSASCRQAVAFRLLVLTVIGVTLVDAPAAAGERKFTYIYESTTLPEGAREYEQWVTWKTNKTSDATYDRFDFRHEIELGLTDDLQLALYGDRRYQDGRSVGDDGAEFHDTAMFSQGAELGLEAVQIEHGRVIYLTKCTNCHSPEPIDNYALDEWCPILDEMADRAFLDGQELADVRAYVTVAHRTLAPR